MNLNDLPDEVLCTIFDNLDVYELKLASIVCRRWSYLTFSGRRMDSVCLVNRNFNCDFLSNTKRNYRNVRQPPVTMTIKDNPLESLERLLHTIKPHAQMLDIQFDVTSEQLGSILLEVPAIQNLSIADSTDPKYRKKNAPFRVLPELKRLNRRQLFSFFRMNIPNLQCLEMNCTTDFDLDIWKTLSGQLKLVHVYDLDSIHLPPFLELAFPRLEDLSIQMFELFFDKERDLERSNDFFRRHPFLRRLSLDLNCSVKLIRNISHHCPELTHLSLVLVYPSEYGFLESLVRLTNLKHLSLEGEVLRKIFLRPMKSLESIELKIYAKRVLLENLFEVVPRLSCLKIMDGICCDVALQFICEKFSYLRSLELIITSDKFLSLEDDSVRIDKLVDLQVLKLSYCVQIRTIHRNNVRCLTITRRWSSSTTKMGDDLYQIAEKFPFLTRLILDEKCSVSVAVVDRLHKLMPSCRIEYGNKRFYPI